MRSVRKLFSKNKDEIDDWEVKEIFVSLDQTNELKRKHLNKFELQAGKEKLLDVLIKDLKMPSSMAKLAVDHILGIKAMYNAGYPREYMKKLLVTKKLVQELHDTKVKLTHMNKQYARASNTIFELRAKLSFAWRREVDDGIKNVLDRIEKIQQALMSKNV